MLFSCDDSGTDTSGCMDDTACNFDAEAIIDDDSCLDDYNVIGYHPPIVQNRKGRSGGGGLVYLKENFESYYIQNKLCYSASTIMGN